MYIQESLRNEPPDLCPNFYHASCRGENETFASAAAPRPTPETF